ncbi:MAG: thiopurine S-methyltransferase [Chromatiaceae bacterium]|jgi:thiopurine S-methyltransferase|nr:thiopurine S-methyltransferase [Chromatiaceae bacterium]
MEPDFWHARWERGEIGWHETEINVHLPEHWPQLGVGPGSRVFVPLCGKSLDLLWLAGEGHRVLGIEISHVAVEAFFAENALTPEVVKEPPFLRYSAGEVEILCGDFFDLTTAYLDGVTAVFDRGSLIAFPPQTRFRYAEHLLRLLRSNAKILLITLNYDQAEMPGPPFSVKDDDVRDMFGRHYHIEPVFRGDVLAENERFRQRGLTCLWEQVYVLRPSES